MPGGREGILTRGRLEPNACRHDVITAAVDIVTATKICKPQTVGLVETAHLATSEEAMMRILNMNDQEVLAFERL